MRNKEEPSGPYITSKTIKLSQGEKSLLPKDPKFSMKYEPTEMALSTEIERMNSKVRYDLGSRKKKKKNKYSSMITDTVGKKLDMTQGEVMKKIDAVNDEGISEELLSAFMDAKHSHIYDPLNENSVSSSN